MAKSNSNEKTHTQERKKESSKPLWNKVVACMLSFWFPFFISVYSKYVVCYATKNSVWYTRACMMFPKERVKEERQKFNSNVPNEHQISNQCNINEKLSKSFFFGFVFFQPIWIVYLNLGSIGVGYISWLAFLVIANAVKERHRIWTASNGQFNMKYETDCAEYRANTHYTLI